MRYYIGIDGGGTKTEAVLADENLRVIKRVMLGGCNPNDVGLDCSYKIISRCIETLLETVPQKSDIELFVFAGIAGIKNHKEEIYSRLLSDYRDFSDIKIDSDAVLPLNSEFGTADCIGIICGTGGVCFVKKGGIIHRIGGWGYLVDGAGSGFSVGREVIEGAYKYSDGRHGSEFLYRKITEMYSNIDNFLLNEIYSKGKPFVASFCPLAFEGAAQNDEYCLKIIDNLITGLAEYIEAARKLVNNISSAVISGGVVMAHPEICRILSQKTGIEVKKARSRPVFGALVGAYSVKNAVSTVEIEKLRQNFDDSYSALVME